jgi:hypothetical protein
MAIFFTDTGNSVDKHLLFRESGDERGEGLAVSGLGEVHYTMGEYNTALTFHQVNMSTNAASSNFLQVVFLCLVLHYHLPVVNFKFRVN